MRARCACSASTRPSTATRSGPLRGRVGQARPLRPPVRLGQPPLLRRAATASAGARRSTTGSREAAARFGIEGALDDQVGGYSTGMKTRLALARSVLHRPELLLYDEPTSGLDPESSHAVLELIREMTDGRLDRGDVHPPAPRGRGPGRPGRRAPGRRQPRGRLARRAHPALLARTPWCASAPTTPPPSTRSQQAPGVVGYERADLTAVVRIDAARAGARPRVRARRRRRAGDPGRAPRADPRGPVLRRPADVRSQPAGHASTGAPSDGRRPPSTREHGRAHPALGARLDRGPHRPQAARPGARLLDPDADPRRRSSSSFVPTVLLFTITQLGNVDAVSQLSQALEVLPERAQAAIQGDTEQARAGYALAVYLFAPVAVVVPLTISTAVGRRHDRRRARAGHRRVPGPLPRRDPGDLPRQAGRQPGPRLRHDDRRVRHLLAASSTRSSVPTWAAGSSPPASGGC